MTPRLAPTLMLALMGVVASAQQAQIRLSNFPSMTVADGRSTITITAEVRDLSGRSVPDGTRIVFSSDLGSFREPIVTTIGGVARAIFVAGAAPGFVKITASAMGGEAAPSTLEVELVADRAMLNSAREYIEIFATDGVQYVADSRLVGASGVNGGAELRFRELTITADDLQYDVKTNSVRARKAVVKWGKGEPRTYDELWLQLNNRRGVGLTTYRSPRTVPVFAGAGFVGVSLDPDGKPIPPVEREIFGTVEIAGSTIRPSSVPVGSSMFRWEDLSESPSSVIARRATVYPRKGIQFQRAEVLVGTAKVVKVPLFELSFTGGNTTPLLTEQFLNIRDNQLAVNFPYYVNLKPGQTSLFRLRTGDSFGRGVSAQRGLFLDFEHSWSRGDAMEGAFTFRGIGRNDWSIGIRQYIRLDDRTTAYASADSPTGNSILGSFGASRQFDGWQASLSGSLSQQLRGVRFTTQDYSFVAERDPIGLGKVPAKLFLGLTALQSRNSLVGGSQGGVGAFARLQSNALRIDRNSTATSSFSVRQLAGQETRNGGLALNGNVAVSRSFGGGASALLSYDYTRDGYTDTIMGQHRLSLNANVNSGRIMMQMSGSRALDAPRDSLFLDLGYRVSPLWRLGYQYTLDRFATSSYLDYNFVLGYRFGWKEIGLTWSYRTKRFGFQVLNVNF